ncbi:MAG: hypothetical protein ACRD98_00420 [Nitrososphaera sp.]
MGLKNEDLNSIQGDPKLIRVLAAELAALLAAVPEVLTVTGPTWTSVAANTTSEQTMTVTGVKTGNFAHVNKPTHQAGLGIVNCRVSAADTVEVTWMNTTAAAITPTASETYRVLHAVKKP